MPIFEYLCKGCEHEFETLVMGEQRPACPKCNGSKLEKLVSSFAAFGSSEASLSKAELPVGPGACGSCGDPRGPGSCSMN